MFVIVGICASKTCLIRMFGSCCVTLYVFFCVLLWLRVFGLMRMCLLMIYCVNLYGLRVDVACVCFGLCVLCLAVAIVGYCAMICVVLCVCLCLCVCLMWLCGLFVFHCVMFYGLCYCVCAVLCVCVFVCCSCCFV